MHGPRRHSAVNRGTEVCRKHGMRRSGLWTTRPGKGATILHLQTQSACLTMQLRTLFSGDRVRLHNDTRLRSPRDTYLTSTACLTSSTSQFVFKAALSLTKHRHCGLCPAEPIPDLPRASVAGRATHREKNTALDMVLGSRAARYRTVDIRDGPESGR